MPQKTMMKKITATIVARGKSRGEAAESDRRRPGSDSDVAGESRHRYAGSEWGEEEVQTASGVAERQEDAGADDHDDGEHPASTPATYVGGDASEDALFRPFPRLIALRRVGDDPPLRVAEPPAPFSGGVPIHLRLTLPTPISRPRVFQGSRQSST
jgi:hypothetical protein